MSTLLLILIYVAFISLGLPDALLGSAWPGMSVDINAPLSGAGVLSMIVSAGTIVSSFLSGRLVRAFGVAAVVVVSVALTALALLGFAFSGHMLLLSFLAIPLGLGAGAVDSVLNAFVALHYRARHMNWLHCFWGIGAMGGPLIMSAALGAGHGWQAGYLVVAVLQLGLVGVLLLSLPLWRSVKKQGEADPVASRTGPPAVAPGLRAIFATPGVRMTLLAFFCYTALELTAGLWGASFLVDTLGFSDAAAAAAVTLYYGGITAGRFASGFISMRLGNRSLIRLGSGLALTGIVVLFIPTTGAALAGLLLLGVGCAPIFPAMLHETPRRFGEGASQNLMGFQMGFAYMGSLSVPPLFGVMADHVGTGFLPLFLLVFGGVMLFGCEQVNRTIRRG